MNTAILAALVAAAGGAIGTYLVAARRLSGKIGTSEAAEIWAESRSLRDHLNASLLLAQQRAQTLEERMLTLERDNAALRAENAMLHRELEELKKELTSMNGLTK